MPRTTLRNRLHGATFRAEARANNHKLTVFEEESLLQWILSLDRRGAAPQHATVREMANILLVARGKTPIQTVGEKWVRNFVNRHKELQTRFSRRYNYQRALCEDPKMIQEWFNLIQITIMQYGILPNDIYNFDETGFAMGLTATARVITRAEYYGRRSVLQLGNREWVTTIESINACGWALPPCIIFKGKTHIQGWYEDASLPNDWRIEVSANGWTTDEIGLQWLQKLFIPATLGRTKGRYQLLILDGHGSHLTPEFDQICSKNDVIPICMPAHSSHLLQPLDIGCFAVLKQAYGDLIGQYMRLGINHIDKIDFISTYPTARIRAFTSETIQNSFAAAGIVPYNPDRVLSKLNICLKTPTPPRSQGSVWTPKTPYNQDTAGKCESTIKGRRVRGPQSPQSPSDRALDYVFKGLKVALNTVAILTKECHDLRAANEKQKQKRTRSKKQISHQGGISIEEARQLFFVTEEAQEAIPTPQQVPTNAASQPAQRAPPKCSGCGIIGHKINRCPNKVDS